ncbi:TolC family protein [Vibrio sp. HN007]|uniref:TolC family protein n=1 Tax=Vibrio iocasae TaxID=3098914 RepID=UPI0035D45BFD
MTFKHTLIAIVVTGLVGCASSSDVNYAERATNSSQVTTAALLDKYIAEHSNQNQEVPDEVSLTDLVDIPELNDYINTALKNNPSLRQSIASLKILYAQKGVTNADRLPTVNASYSGNAKEDSDDSYTGDVTVSWELDVWNKLGASVAASDKDIANSQATLQETQDVLVANIMRTWLQISLYEQLVEIETRRLDILENNEDLVLQRYQVGLGSLKDLDDARTSSASTRSTLAGYQESLAKSQRSLVLLTGEWGKDASEIVVSASFPDVINPVSQLSDQTLSRRPDVKAAYYSIEAEALRTEAAYKAMLPSIDLSASLTSVADNPSDALLVSPLWSLLGKMSAPFFQGGALKSAAEKAELTTEKSFWVYQDTLLTAVNEVENALGQEYSFEQQQQHLSDALASAQRSSDNYEESYRQGLVNILDLLTVQQTTYDTEAQLVNTIYERLVNRIDLGLALGLGYKA